MKNQFIALLIISMIVLAYICPDTAMGYTQNEAVDIAVETMICTGIMNMMEDGQFHPEFVVSRGEFARIIYNIYHPFGHSVNVVSKAKNFRDISGTEYEDAILFANSMGLMNGYNENEFDPYGNVEYRQALKVFVNMLGYGELAESISGYPDGYIWYAGQLGLTNGITASYDYHINRGTLALLAYRVIKTEIANWKYRHGSLSYYTEKGLTLWRSLFNINYNEGIVTADNISGLTDTNRCADGSIEIDEQIYYLNNGVDATGLLGRKVSFFYEESNDICTIYCINLLARNKSNDIVLKTEDIEGISGNTYYYTDNGHTYSVTFEKSANIIYNGRFVPSLSEEYLIPQYGYVELYDSHNKGVYDLVKITNYITVVVNQYSEAGFILSDKFDNTKNISFDPSLIDFYEIKNDMGNVVDPIMMNENDVLTLSVSMDGRVIRGYYSNSQENLWIKSYIGEDEVQFSDDIRTYKTVPGYFSYKEPRHLVGEKVKVCLDYNGRIAAILSTDKNYIFSYLVRFYLKQSIDTDGLLMLEFFEEHGDFVQYCVDGKISIDGLKCKNPTAAYNRLVNNIGGMPPSICIISHDEQGALLSIDTPYIDESYEDKNASLRLIYTAYDENYNLQNDKMLYYRNTVQTFGGKISISPDTKVFLVPSTIGSDISILNYQVVSQSYFTNDTLWGFEAYQSELSYGYAPLLVLYDRLSENSVDSGVGSALVSKSELVYDEETGEEKLKLTYILNGAVRTAFCGIGGVADKAGPGDVVKLAINKKNEIIALEVYYDYSKNEILNSTTGLDDVNMNIFGYIYSKYNGFISVAKDKSTLKNDYYSISDELWRYYGGGFRVYKFNSRAKDNKTVLGTLNDLRDYVHYGMDCSKVFISTRYGHGRIIVIYE